ncbi:MAG: heat shock protein transcriptional repressor HspR [Coriobacteriales bacterium]
MAKNNDENRPLYMISVAAELAGVHPQTLRSYEAKGLIVPKRTAGNTRMYSQADIDRLGLINDLTDEGINLAGVIRILDLEKRLEEREKRIEQLERKNRQLEKNLHDLRMKQTINAIVKVDDEPRKFPWDFLDSFSKDDE